MKKSIIAAVIAASMVPAAQAADVTIKLGGGGLKAADKAAEVKFQVGGRLQWDYNNATFTPDGGDETTDESNLDVRRARLFVKTQIGNWALKSQFNVAEENESEVDTDGGTDTADVRSDGGGTVEDLYIQYKGWGKAAKLTIGRQKAELGLEELTSSKDITFLERNAATEEYALGRGAGIQLQGDIDNFHYGVGLFEAGEGSEAAGDVALVARGTYALKSDNNVFHAGASFADLREDTTRYGLELAGVSGPFHAQAEFFNNDADGAETDAYYIQLGYVLSGESRPYKGGKFKRIKPSKSSGAYEVVVRYVDGDGNFSDVELSDTNSTEYGIGFNYYANKNVRLGATYSVGEVQETNDERNEGDEGSEFRVRAQLVF